jgi:hypothetical protein
VSYEIRSRPPPQIAPFGNVQLSSCAIGQQQRLQRRLGRPLQRSSISSRIVAGRTIPALSPASIRLFPTILASEDFYAKCHKSDSPTLAVTDERKKDT